MVITGETPSEDLWWCSPPKQQIINGLTEIEGKSKTMSELLCLACDALEQDLQRQNTKHVYML